MPSLPLCLPLPRADAAMLQSARSAFVDALLGDMLGFGACKMIRRILGFAHVIDFDRIQDAALRADREASALTMGVPRLILSSRISIFQ